MSNSREVINNAPASGRFELAGSHPKTQYQRRKIGDSGWAVCTKSQFEYCENHPLYETRKT